MATSLEDQVALEIRVRLARRSRDQRTLRWLSARSGITAAALGRKLNGLRSISVNELGAIAEALDIPPQDLVAMDRTQEPEAA